MKKSFKEFCLGFIFSILTITLSLISCKKTENPIKYLTGTFPDSTFALTDLNSASDDYSDLNAVVESIDTYNHKIYGDITLTFTSDKSGSGNQFDLVQGVMTFVFNQTDGNYGIGCDITTDPFLTKLINAANTTRNDLGPYRLFSPADGYEYLLLASQNTNGNLDFYYLRNMPVSGSSLPAVLGPYPATLLNTSADDAYICFDSNQDTAYFSSNTGGDFEIYLKKKPSETPVSTWLNNSYSASSAVDSINTTSDEICPFVLRKIMVFASNRPGGMGGFDLYYSIFRNGKWSTPANFGPGINTVSDEYRPLIVSHTTFTNKLLVFSSNRPGGKGGFDLYSRGVTIKY